MKLCINIPKILDELEQSTDNIDMTSIKCLSSTLTKETLTINAHAIYKPYIITDEIKVVFSDGKSCADID